MTLHTLAVTRLLDLLPDWCAARPDIRACALVGSYARGAARDDSDVDIVILTERSDSYRGADWVASLPWDRFGGTVVHTRDEEFGVVWSRFVFLSGGLEVEFGFTSPAWASLDPLDPGTAQVIRDGCRNLYDPDGLYERLIAACNLKPEM